MSTWSFFAASTGMLTGQRFTGPRDALEANTPAGCESVAGAFDYLSQRVDLESGEVVDWTPPAPADDELQTWSWDAARRRWIATPTTAAHWQAVRARRNELLTASDWIVSRSVEAGNPVPQAWRDYRQALRDVTTQADPLAIVWPVEPR